MNVEGVTVGRFRRKLICGTLRSGFLLAPHPLNGENHFWHLAMLFQHDHKICMLFQEPDVSMIRSPGLGIGNTLKHIKRTCQHILTWVKFIFIAEIICGATVGSPLHWVMFHLYLHISRVIFAIGTRLDGT